MFHVKSEPELQHILAHLALAIEALAAGHRGEAQYELQSVDGLIFFHEKEVIQVAKKKKKCRCRR